MYKLIWDEQFLRKLSKLTKNNSQLKELFRARFDLLEIDPFDPTFKTHKLHGKLNLLLASSVDYDYRIVFLIKEIESKNYIVLVDIGTHDEVY